MTQETILKSNKIFKYIPLSYPICLLRELGCNWEESSVAIPRHAPLLSPFTFCCSCSSLETVRSDNDDVHENVAEKWTSHPLKIFCDYPKSPCYLKEENFWNLREGPAPEFRRRWYNLLLCCFPFSSTGLCREGKEIDKKAWCTF